MSARHITITRDGNILVIRGWKVAQLARQAGLSPTYAGTVGGWMLDAKRLPDLVAHLEYRNVRYALEGEAPTPRVVSAATTPEPEAAGLW